jgi:hypothetical protein
MIGYIVGLREQDREVYDRYARRSLWDMRIPVVEAWTAGDDDRLALQYNHAIDVMLTRTGDDIVAVVFLHPDVLILDHDFNQRVEHVLGTYPEVGLIGVLGATYLPPNGNWWSADPQCLRGHVIQEYEDASPRHVIKGKVGYHDDLVCVDGFCLVIRASLLRSGLRFDPIFPNYLHTDTDICFGVLAKGFKIAVFDVLLQHRSEGKRADSGEWVQARKILFQKWLDNSEWDKPVHQRTLQTRTG